jgi:UDP-N-acetylglucosamine diphosphorylase/glucosamine-1-phosphate N-acetyltransferase
MQIQFLKDENPLLLSPITLTRDAQEIRSGGTTLLELTELFQKEVSKKPAGTLFLNPKAIPSYTHLKDTITLAKKGKEFKFVTNKNIVAVYSLKNNDSGFGITETETNWPLFTKLSEVVSYNGVLLIENAPFLAKHFKKLPKTRNVFVGKNVSVDTTTRFDTTKGPVILGDSVTVLPFSYLVGPLVIGSSSIVSPHAYISHSSIGPVSKVGGEVTHATIQGYSNKAHAGFLGHSYIGEWVNLGGGSLTSNLKNTYGTIRMQGNESGEQLLGSIIGDWSKISAGVIISAGKVLGVNTIVYGTVTKDVPSFTNYVKSDTLIECPLEVAITVAARMRIRRDLATPTSYADLMSRAFEATREERKRAGVIKGKLEF